MTRRAPALLAIWGGAAWIATAAADVEPLLAAMPLLTGAGMTVLVDRRARASRVTLGARSSVSDPEKHLARSRRREEEALVFAVRVPAADPERVAALADAFRITDGVGVSTYGRDRVVHGVVEAAEDGVRAIAHRVYELGLAPQGSVGWARFPSDGVTLAALIDVALAASGERAGRRLPRLSENHDLARADGRGEPMVWEAERA